MADSGSPDDAEDNSYIVERLLSEAWIEGTDGKQIPVYLIKWEGYGLHEYA